MSALDRLKKVSWVTAGEQAQSPVILRRFFADDCMKAQLTLTACGFFEVKINGQLVTEQMFLPVVTDFENRSRRQWLYPLTDTLTHRLYCYTFDVTRFIHDGENEMSIQLGNGWYRQTERVAEGNMSFGTMLKTAYYLQVINVHKEQIIVSDGNETWRNSEIAYNNIFVGEVIDPKAEDILQYPISLCDAPETLLCEAIGTPDRVVRTLIPQLIDEKDGVKLYDVGENISGLVRVATSAPSGTKITLRFSEELHEDNTLNFHSAGGGYTCTSGKKQIQTDVFICDGTSRTYCPKFVWHAFRYFEIEGSFDNLEALVIHSDTPVTSAFESSSEGLNFLYDAYIRTQLDNMHGSIPSDCPHRERLGYTGDGQVCAPAAMLLLDSREFYRKWIVDILDCQDKVGGHVQHTAPAMGGGGGPGGWGCAIVLVPWAYYKQFGDLAMLKLCYEPMRKWVSYLQKHCENGLVVREEAGGWCLGDWCTRDPIRLPEPFVNTCFFIKILEIMCHIAKIIKQRSDIPLYQGISAILQNAVCKAYKDMDTGSFCEGVQGADAYAVWAGLSDVRTVKKLAEKYDALGHFDTGFIATDILSELLVNCGAVDTFFRLTESEDMGSFLYMKRRGATTVWENWNGDASHNHPMFGACCRYLFTGILGIGQAENSAAYRSLVIAPKIPKDLEFASGSVVLPCGKVSVAFFQTEEGIHFRIELPENREARFMYGGDEYIMNGGLYEFTI